MGILEELDRRVLVYDGSKGVMLQRMGLTSGEVGETWNVLFPEKVRKLYASYRNAGSDVLQTNTFSANRISLASHGAADKLREINYEGVRLAKEAADGAFVAASVGPTGQMMAPFGPLTFQKAYEVFAEQVTVLAEAGADAIHFETFMDLNELKAAILAAKENTSLPVFASVALGEGGATLMGSTPAICAVVCAAAGADVVGVNCSFGPEKLISAAEEMARFSSLPILAKPNAGLPVTTEKGVSYSETPETFAGYAEAFLRSGVRLIGGCCGSSPEFVAALKEKVCGAECMRPEREEGKFICSHGQMLDLAGEYETAEVDAAQDPDDLVDDAQDAAEDGDAILLNFGEGADYDIAEMTANFCSMVKTPVILTGDSDSAAEFIRYYPGICGVTEELKELCTLGAVLI